MAEIAQRFRAGGQGLAPRHHWLPEKDLVSGHGAGMTHKPRTTAGRRRPGPGQPSPPSSCVLHCHLSIWVGPPHPTCALGSEPGPSGLEMGSLLLPWDCRVRRWPSVPRPPVHPSGFALLLGLLAFAMYSWCLRGRRTVWLAPPGLAPRDVVAALAHLQACVFPLPWSPALAAGPSRDRWRFLPVTARTLSHLLGSAAVIALAPRRAEPLGPWAGISVLPEDPATPRP